MRILIVRLSSIGDIVHALPALAAIRRALPNAEISWAAERPAVEILRDNPSLDHLIEVDTKAVRRVSMSGETLLAPRQQLRRLRASSFDAALDLQGLFKSAMVARLARARRTYGFAREALREPLSRLLLKETVRVPLREHVIAKNLALVAGALNISVPINPTDFEFPIGVGSQYQHEANEALRGHENDYAILNPGGGWPTKLWSVERFGALADELWTNHKLRSIVAYGPGEEHLAASVMQASRSGKASATKLSLKGFYALAKHASLYVGGDTGPTHLAMAANAPIVGLFGPTEWWFNGSPRADDICVERTEIECRIDCNRRACSNWICMDIQVEQVLAAATERLRRAQKFTAKLESVVVA
jgi:heptosyltransferase-1